MTKNTDITAYYKANLKYTTKCMEKLLALRKACQLSRINQTVS